MIKEVFPKKIDMKAAQFEFQRLVDAFLDLAEAELSGKRAAAGAPTHTGNADRFSNVPLSMPVSINGNPR